MSQDQGPTSRIARLRRACSSAALASFVAAVLIASGTAAAQPAPEPEQLFSAVEASLAELPHDRFDVAAVIEQARATTGAGGDIADALFAWVRDETGLSPYRGVLKGPAGVLMDRSGNSLDRALLLRELLLAAGEQAVLATAQLDAAALAQVAAAVRPAPRDTSLDAAQGAALAQRLADELGADAATTALRLSQAEQARLELLERLWARTDAQTAALAQALAPVLVAADPAGLLIDHWWVQVQRGGAWVDLDPTLPGAAVGDTVTPATARFGPTTLAQLAAIEGSCADLSCGERLHSVVVSAQAERWDGSRLSESELFSVELLPAQLIGRAVAFVASPDEWPDDLDLFGIVEPTAALREALLATSSWRPVLLVGEQQHGQMTLKDDGSVSEPSSGGAGALGGGIGGMFGGFGGGGGSAGGELTAVWLEFELRTPGTPVRVERRAVFDLLGPAARAQGVTSYEADETARLARAAALAGDVQLAIFPATLHPAVVSARASGRLLANRQAWTDLYWSGATADPSFLLERQNDMAALVTPLESYELLRARAADPHAGASAAAQSGIGVAAFHRALDLELRPYSSFDLVFGPLSGAGGATELTSGVLDANLEALLQDQYARQAAGAAASAGATTRAVADAFAADLAAGRPWQLVDSVSALDALAPGLPGDLRQRVLDTLGRGQLAVVPVAGEEAIGFWSFDPVTGSVVAVGDRGWGQALTEYDVVTNIVLQLRTVINQYASMAQCLGIALTMPLRGETGVTDELAECAFNLVCGQLNTAINTLMVTETNWTNVILSATIDALWGGAPEVGFGGFCGGLWSRISGG